MKGMFSTVLTLLALAIPLAPAAFASEAELSEIERPVDAAATQYPQYSNPGGSAMSEAVLEEQVLLEPLHFEGH